MIEIVDVDDDEPEGAAGTNSTGSEAQVDAESIRSERRKMAAEAALKRFSGSVTKDEK